MVFTWVSEGAAFCPTGCRRIAENLLTFNSWICPMFAVKHYTFKSDEVSRPTGRIAQQVRVKNHRLVVIASEVHAQVDGDSLESDVGARFRGFDARSKVWSVIHGLPRRALERSGPLCTDEGRKTQQAAQSQPVLNHSLSVPVEPFHLIII